MYILFLDDSETRDSWHVGYGGFCVSGEHLCDISNDVDTIKRKHKIPLIVEIKWSPGPSHFLRTKFTGVRHDLYKDIISCLSKYEARIICAVHALKECYGVKLHGWSRDKATKWAIRQQLRFISERYNMPFLTTVKNKGIIICDEYGNKLEEESATKQFLFDMACGTNYNTMENIGHVPLVTCSKNSNHIQIADILIGVVTSAISGGKYGLALFDDVARHFLWNPHEKAISFTSIPSSAIVGYGLKIFPASLASRAYELFEKLNSQYVIDNNGWRENIRGA